jgi:phage protein D
MVLIAHSRTLPDLYVPAATIDLGAVGSDMRQAHGLVATQVEVDLQLSVAGQFRFTIPNTFHAERADFLTPGGAPVLPLLALGTRIWIRMGYGDRARQKLLFSGFITVVGTAFAEGGSPELEVSGTDATYRMTLGTSEHRFEQKKVSDAVNKVAAENGFDLKFAGTPPDNLTLDSNLQTDLEFLGKLAQNFSTPEQKWEFYARADERQDKLHFRPRRKDDPPIATLQWGADLLSFKPEVNLGNQVSKVEVHGWDEVAKKKILGVARAGQGQDGAVPGGDIQRRAFGKETVLELRFPVKSKHEADQRAAAELAKRTNDLVKGEGETFGFPELLPDTTIALAGLGSKFSATYYVTKTVHRYDTSGYRTRFSIERPVA